MFSSDAAQANSNLRAVSFLSSPSGKELDRANCSSLSPHNVTVIEAFSRHLFPNRNLITIFSLSSQSCRQGKAGAGYTRLRWSYRGECHVGSSRGHGSVPLLCWVLVPFILYLLSCFVVVVVVVVSFILFHFTGPGSSKPNLDNPGLVKSFISIYDPANCMCLNEEKPGPFVWFSTSQCIRFGRESVSYTQINWQASFDLIWDLG